MTCSTAMDVVGGIWAWGLFEKVLLSVAEVVCIVFKLADEPVRICPQIVPQMGYQLFPVLSGYLFTRDRVCDEWLGWCSAPVYEAIDLHNLVSEILSTKPKALRQNNYMNDLYEQISTDKKPRSIIKAVHMSDPHLDFLYTPGTLANCDSYLCCREVDGYPT